MKLTEKIADILEASSNLSDAFKIISNRLSQLDHRNKEYKKVLDRAKKGQSSLEPEEVKDMEVNLTKGEKEHKALTAILSDLKGIL